MVTSSAQDKYLIHTTASALGAEIQTRLEFTKQGSWLCRHFPGKGQNQRGQKSGVMASRETCMFCSSVRRALEAGPQEEAGSGPWSRSRERGSVERPRPSR